MRFGHRFDNARFAVLLALLGVCFLTGGASRTDVMSLILLQPFAALCALAFLLLPGPVDWRAVRIPLLLLTALGAVMAAQLIPLPPALWTNLPGHAPFIQSALAVGMEQPWRPISLTPDLTLDSLVGLIVPLAVLMGFAAIDSTRRRALLAVILIGAGLSALIGLTQVAGGSQSPFYMYKITNLGSAVGAFANRNHQAVLLAMAWPLLMVWASLPHRDRHREALRRWVAAGAAIFLLPLLLVTGSRAGLVLGAVGLAGAALLWRALNRDGLAALGRWERLAIVGAGVAGVLVLIATITLSRAEAVQRMLTLTSVDDTRAEATPVLIEMARDFFPVGAGFGSFDPLFRVYEPPHMLGAQYLNHAHNDLLEMLITGGLPGLLLVLVFILWASVRTVRAWRAGSASPDAALARAASIMIGIVLLSSLIDYPLRTPLMMTIFAIGCGWLAAPGASSVSRRAED